jgi:hypothetical protein
MLRMDWMTLGVASLQLVRGGICPSGAVGARRAACKACRGGVFGGPVGCGLVLNHPFASPDWRLVRRKVELS